MLEDSMFIARFLLASLIASAPAQDATLPAPIQVRTLTIISDSLPEAERQRIVHGLQGIETDARGEELAERVRQYLRNAGYFNARAEDMQVSGITETQAGRSADFSVRVEPEDRYTLGDITFQDAKAFSSDQLRRQFPLKGGELLYAAEMSRGLENLRNLYAAKGYANFVAIDKPMIDKTRHVVDIIIVINEGRPVSFGSLRLEGMEPFAGAGRSLLASWKDIQGKLYSPEVLKQWLATNTSGWPHEAASTVNTQFVAGSAPDVAVDVLLHFQ
jgi:outer membrane translocation and assembly module TamA